MPFDTLVVHTPSTLTDHLTDLGITPVPLSVLKAHKKAQVRKYPPSLFVTPKPYLLIALAVTTVNLAAYWHKFGQLDLDVVGGTVVLASMCSELMFVVVTLVSGLLVSGLLGVQFRGPAVWKEYRRFDAHMLPQPIQAITKTVQDHFGDDASVLYGELEQAKMILDPYILVWFKGETACLGIWDDDKIIACATMI